jgi:GntR family transcriptional regulator
VKRTEKFEEALIALREQIIRGTFGERGQMPPLSTLASEFGVKNTSMSEVIRILQAEGLIASAGNRRLTATPPRKRIPLMDKPFVEYIKAEGLEPVTDYVEEPARLPMSEELAARFRVPEGTPYVARIRRDGTTIQMYRLTNKYYLSELIDDETLAAMQANNRHDTILDIKKKKHISSRFMLEETITRLPTEQERELLGIARISPILVVTRTCYDEEGGRVLWFNSIAHVGSLFVLRHEYHGEQLWSNSEGK